MENNGKMDEVSVFYLRPVDSPWIYLEKLFPQQKSFPPIHFLGEVT